MIHFINLFHFAHQKIALKIVWGSVSFLRTCNVVLCCLSVEWNIRCLRKEKKNYFLSDFLKTIFSILRYRPCAWEVLLGLSSWKKTRSWSHARGGDETKKLYLSKTKNWTWAVYIRVEAYNSRTIEMIRCLNGTYLWKTTPPHKSNSWVSWI